MGATELGMVAVRRLLTLSLMILLTMVSVTGVLAGNLFIHGKGLNPQYAEKIFHCIEGIVGPSLNDVHIIILDSQKDLEQCFGPQTRGCYLPDFDMIFLSTDSLDVFCIAHEMAHSVLWPRIGNHPNDLADNIANEVIRRLP